MSDSIEEKMILLKKLCKLFFQGKLTADEIFYILDVLLVPDLLEVSKKLSSKDLKIIEYLAEELAYYQPDNRVRQESELLFGKEELMLKLKSILEEVDGNK